jgi:hypothetical protein
MKRSISMLAAVPTIALLVSIPMLARSETSAAFDTRAIERLTGAKGQLNAEEATFKVSVPRTDLNLRADGVRMTPPLGLSSWATFMHAGNQTMVMGDTVLTEAQVNPVMSAALDSGLQVTALHNHFLWETPRLMFMHISGMGDEAAMATAVGKVFAKIKATTGQTQAPSAEIDPGKTTLDPKKIEAVLGRKGELGNGVYKITIGRTVKMHGHTVGSSMGVNTWLAFAGSDEHAVVDGDFAMLESELQGVLKAMRAADINVVTIHNHMTEEQPRMMFLHYWGVGTTTHLANGLRAALAATAQ